MEEQRREKQEEEVNKLRREQRDDRLRNAQLRALKRGRLALKEEKDAVKEAAMYAHLSSTMVLSFMPDEEIEVTRVAPLVEECLDDVRARAVQRGWTPLAQHWKVCLSRGVLASAAMQPYLRRWAAADAADAAAAAEAAPP